ncbi:MAG: LpxI family protein [Candidatus Puniceispirillaceae bacterium]
MERLGIIAGGGKLPYLVATLSEARGVEPVIVTLSGQDCDDLSRFRPVSFYVTQIESIIQYFLERKVTNIVMVGKVERPRISPDLPVDKTAAQLLAQTLSEGDDAALRAILAVMMSEGLQVIPLQSVIPDQKLPSGYDTNPHSDYPHDSLVVAKRLHIALGALDVGQSAIIQGRRVLAIEGAEGTDNMIQRSAELRDPAQISLFFKASKTAQNKMLDPPVMGPDTILLCAKAGINIIAIEAEHCVLAAPMQEIEALCQAHDIRLLSVSFDEEEMA